MENKMKKAMLSVVAVMLTTSVCFAQSAMMSKPMISDGIVKSVSVADAVKGTKSQIVITDVKGAEETFVVSAKTVIIDNMGKPSLLSSIVGGVKVAVNYKTVAGVNEAVAVKILG
jgi:hypothetical protein